MRFTRASVGLGVSSLFALGCGSDKVVGPASQITLSAAQATVLMNKIGQFAPLHNQIAWLADSANLVIKSGSQVDLILVSTNLAPGPFYAVGLQRAVQLTGSSFSTFNLIAFDDPSNPTNFIVIDGFNSGTGAPPTSTSGNFDGPVNGYLFHVDGSTLASWHAALGTATFTAGTPGGACSGFQSSAGVTCALSDLTVSFSITAAFQDAGPPISQTAQANLASTSVSGIVLSYPAP